VYTLTCTYRGVNLVLSRAGGAGRAKDERDRTEGGRKERTEEGRKERTEEGRKGGGLGTEFRAEDLGIRTE